jgi:hypothetical protein
MLSTGKSYLLNLLGLLPFITCFQNIRLQAVSAEITRGQGCLWVGIARYSQGRKPTFLLALPGLIPLRFADCKLWALLIKEPPRTTRLTERLNKPLGLTLFNNAKFNIAQPNFVAPKSLFANF